MRITRWLPVAALALAALSGCSIIWNFQTLPAVELSVDDTTLLAGERVAVVADVYNPENDILSYTWFEDGSVIHGETGRILHYWNAVSDTTYTQVSVAVRNDHGGYGTDSVDFTIEPRYGGVFVVNNQSSKDVWYFQDSLAASGKWSGDRLGSDIIPAGSSYPIVQDTAYGYAYNSWDLRAIPFGEDQINPDPANIWQWHDVDMNPYQVYPLTIID
jgi:hypothetical protein